MWIGKYCPFTAHKKLILSLLLIAVVIAGALGMGQGVLAHDGPAGSHTNANANIIPPPHTDVSPPTAGNATPQTDLSYWYGAIAVTLEFIRGVLTKILAIAAFLLNVAFKTNLLFVPSYDPIVQTGWVVLRDMVNGLFIIIVLWISLTIILGIEQYGGKKLLTKVLAVAVLINFSLAIVTAVVVFSNQFALVFYNKIFPSGNEDLSAMIIGFTNVQSATDFLDKKRRETLIESLEKPLTPAQQESCVSKYKSGAISVLGSIGPCAVAGFKSLQAGIAKAGVNAIGKSIAETLGIPQTARIQAISVAISLIIYFIITAAFVYAAIALWIRLLALMLLSIFSPVAMIAMVLPVPKAKEGWGQWQQEFLKWVFFAPVFYFLMYLALLMGYTMNKAIKEDIPPGSIDIGSDARLFLSFTIVIMMLIFAERYAKKTAGKAGEITVDLAKKAAGLAVGVTAGVATGGTLMAMRGVARGVVRAGEKKPGGRLERWTPRAVRRVGVQSLVEKRKGAEERMKNYSDYSTSQLQSDSKGSLLMSQENAARFAVLAQRKDGFKDAKGKNLFSEEQMRRIKELLRRNNMGDVIAKTNLTLADMNTIGAKGREELKTYAAAPSLGGMGASEEIKAIQYAGQNISGRDIDTDNFDVGVFDGDDAKAEAARAGMVRNTNLTQSRIEKFVQKSYSGTKKLVDDLNTFVRELDAQITNIDNQIAGGGTTQEIAALNVKKSDLQRQRAPKQAILSNLRTTPGGRALGLAAPALTLTGSRVVTGDNQLTLDINSRIRGGSGKYTFAFPADQTPANFKIDNTGILSPNPANAPTPGRYPIVIEVTDTADPTSRTTITVYATVR